MTTYIAFQPSLQTPFQFQATFDGAIYTVVCTWNLFGQRFYINVYDTSNNLIVCRPQVGSPATYNLNLVAGYFQNSVLVYRTGTGNFEIDPAAAPPLNFPPPVTIEQQEYFTNNGGVLMIGYAVGYPISPTGLTAGSIFNNGQVVMVAGTTTPNPSALPVYYGQITPPQLLALGGSNLPTSAPTSGSLQLWNNGGVVMIA